jgi:hypothetical protein
VVKGSRRIFVALVAAIVGGAAGCAPAAPSPSPAADQRPPDSTAESATAGVESTSTPAPSPGLRDEIEVRSVDRALSDSILEFASDGTSIIFSSGVAEDAGPDAAPDLWRLQADAADPVPELLWRNPNRDHSIVKLAGDAGAAVFVDIPLDGSRAWDLWLLPRGARDPILLDSHPGDERVSSLVPSFSLAEASVAWTAFDIGPDGPVSQLWLARGPGWQPVLLQERLAHEAELWFPSLTDTRLAFSEVRYSDDRTTDRRNVHMLELGAPGAQPQQVSDSDLATMPVLAGDTLIWKEADPGFSMFNWGLLWRHDTGAARHARLDTDPAGYVNYPSAGLRFVAWWDSNAFDFVVYDLVEDKARVIERYDATSQANVLRPHIAGDLLVWLHVVGEGPGTSPELRYAFMPPVRLPR